MQLVWPALRYLPSYRDALERGWSFNNERPEAGREELAQIESDPERFVDGLVDFEGTGELQLPDGTIVPRLPGFRRWIWDDGFCGSIGLRWQPGTTALPPYCLGHIGYGVVPWRRRQGHATAALRELLPDARLHGLPFVHITADAANVVSQKVILANGGVLLGEEEKPPMYRGGRLRRYRIDV